MVIGVEFGDPAQTITDSNIPSELFKGINIESFASTLLVLLGIGWLLEGIVTAFAIKYLSRVRPDLISAQRA